MKSSLERKEPHASEEIMVDYVHVGTNWDTRAWISLQIFDIVVFFLSFPGLSCATGGDSRPSRDLFPPVQVQAREPGARNDCAARFNIPLNSEQSLHWDEPRSRAASDRRGKRPHAAFATHVRAPRTHAGVAKRNLDTCAKRNSSTHMCVGDACASHDSTDHAPSSGS